jgi:hypothetical protein
MWVGYVGSSLKLTRVRSLRGLGNDTFLIMTSTILQDNIFSICEHSQVMSSACITTY